MDDKKIDVISDGLSARVLVNDLNSQVIQEDSGLKPDDFIQSPTTQSNNVLTIAETPELATGTPLKPSRPSLKNGATEKKSTTNQTAANYTSHEFVVAIDCADCVVPMPENPQVQSTDDATTDVSEADTDFRTSSTTGCCSIGEACAECLIGYDRISRRFNSRYLLPLWIILMAAPISAGIMGAINMNSCPASHILPSTVFSIGISLMAVLALRVCVIVSEMTCNCNNSENMRRILRTLSLVATFVTVLFFITESVLFWLLDTLPEYGNPKFCNSDFVNYLFYWNCTMWFIVVPLAIFPV